MISKLKSLKVDIKLIDGIIFLMVLSILPLNLWLMDVQRFISLDVWTFVVFYGIQIVFALVLAIEFEEIYLNYKKAHSFVLAFVVLATLFALTYYIGSFGYIGTLILALMVYLLTHRFVSMKNRVVSSKKVTEKIAVKKPAVKKTSLTTKKTVSKKTTAKKTVKKK